METREYHTIDKAAWGDGPWLHEPDKRQWKDGATGLPCLIVRGPSGSLCGYVGVDETHPAYGLGYSHYDHDNDGNPVPMTPIQDAINDLEAHGGITFADSCQDTGDESLGICHTPGPGEPDAVWWFGFDCAHSGDFNPGINSRLPEELRERLGSLLPWGRTLTYRDQAYVRRQCEELAEQLRQMAAPQAA